MNLMIYMFKPDPTRLNLVYCVSAPMALELTPASPSVLTLGGNGPCFETCLLLWLGIACHLARSDAPLSTCKSTRLTNSKSASRGVCCSLLAPFFQSRPLAFAMSTFAFKADRTIHRLSEAWPREAGHGIMRAEGRRSFNISAPQFGGAGLGVTSPRADSACTVQVVMPRCLLFHCHSIHTTSSLRT